MTVKTQIKVTRIKNNWHARLFVDGLLVDEMSCKLRLDIGWCCRTMMRWADKMGRCNAHTSSARRRNTGGPVGQVKYLGKYITEKIML